METLSGRNIVESVMAALLWDRSRGISLHASECAWFRIWKWHETPALSFRTGMVDSDYAEPEPE